VKKSFALTIAGTVALAVAAVPSAASAQVPDPLPDESIAEVAQAAGFTTLLTAATAAELDGVLADCDAGPFTVFAPTNDAFAALDEDLLTAALGDPDGLLTDILNYHIVPGILSAADVTSATSLTTALGADLAVSGTTLNGTVNITGTDNFACNGVVHIIDAVLVPELPSIAAVATEGGFNTLVAALTAADLAGTFADCAAGPFTVFAPTDAAFAAALQALGLTAEQLLADTATLTTVLQYHVVPGIVGSAEVLESTSLTTLQGENITVAGAVLNGSADITATDNWACNGVVHVIDAVLLPPSLTEPAPTTTTTAPATTAPVTELPATGNENVVMAMVASVLLLAGLGLLAVRRRSTSV
jgi:transforming growth factor-beta-induced protein